MILPKCKETTNSKKLRIDESSRTSRYGLSVLLLGGGLMFQVRPPPALRPILLYGTPFLEVNRDPF
jgi:hypothetical protein